MSDSITNIINELDMVPPLDPMEIRIHVHGGVVQSIDRGSLVPDAMSISVIDFDVENLTIEEIEQMAHRCEGTLCVFDEEGARQ